MKKTKIFLVTMNWDYEPGITFGAFSTLKKANDAIKKKIEEGLNCDDWTIETLELDEIVI